MYLSFNMALTREERRLCRNARKLISSVRNFDDENQKKIEQAIKSLKNIKDVSVAEELLWISKKWHLEAENAIKNREKSLKTAISILDKQLKLNANQ